ncbi:MAG: P27 family phage terminase small subunit [Acidimicrobiales bacterium]
MTGARGPISGRADPERQRRLGNPGKRSLEPVKATTATFPPRWAVPPVPADLGVSGVALWRTIWAGASWLSVLDEPAVERFVRLHGERTTYAEIVAAVPVQEVPIVTPTGAVVGARLEPNPAEAALRRADKAIDSLSAALGLTPASRARLAVAQVEIESRAERLLAARKKEPTDGIRH